VVKGKRVALVKITVDGVEVDAKACTKCGEVKVLREFYSKSRGRGGRTANCIPCICEYNQSKYDEREVEVFRERRYGRYAKWTAESYRAHVSLESSGEYSVVGNYEGFRARIEHVHNICGEAWKTTPSRFLEGKKCPRCAESRGERRVRKYLTDHSYAFTAQSRFDNCRNINPLPFDFAVHLPDRDVLIEYDGEQHYRPVSFGRDEVGTYREFVEIKRRDRIKDDYCRANGIDLIRIRYDQFDEIETILERRLSALDITGKCPNVIEVAA